MERTPSAASPAPNDARRVHLLARNLYREMRAQGFSPDEVIAVSSALLECLRADMTPPARI